MVDLCRGPLGRQQQLCADALRTRYGSRVELGELLRVSVKAVLHEYGVNLRHLGAWPCSAGPAAGGATRLLDASAPPLDAAEGAIRSLIPASMSHLRALLLLEMVARCWRCVHSHPAQLQS